MAVAHGAAAVGLVSAMPSGPGVISEALIQDIASAIPPGVATFLLTSQLHTEAIVEQQRRCGVNTIQLCDAVDAQTHANLRTALPGVQLVQVIHVVGEESIQEAKRVAPNVHAILLDSGNPSLPTKELGGTGRMHNWDISRRIVQAVAVPVFLAGGLSADNVAKAIEEVRPYAVDVCSGVRTHDQLDETKLRGFFAALG